MSSLTQYLKVKLTNLVTAVFTFSLRRQTTGQFFHITVVIYILDKIIKFVKNIAICNTSSPNKRGGSSKTVSKKISEETFIRDPRVQCIQ